MANGFEINEDTFKNIPQEQRDWILFTTVIALRKDVEALKAKKWFNSGCAVVGGIIGGLLWNIGKLIGVK